MAEPIPVLMYHSVAPEIKAWAVKYLSIHPGVFEDHICTLSASGFESVSLSQLHEYVSGYGRLPPKALVLTFDEGYRDNRVFAFPILREYGLKAAISVSADFIDRGNMTRPNLADVWEGGSGKGDLEWRGFLGQDEIKRLLASDLIDIQGHCKAHTWYFTSGKIVDSHYPGDPYPWLAWNARPDRNHPYLKEDHTDFVPLGSPVCEHGEALVARRYFADPRVDRALHDHVSVNGNQQFFERPGWRDELHSVAGPADKHERE